MDQDTTSLIWTIIAIVAIFYLLNYLMTCKETSSEKFHTGEEHREFLSGEKTANHQQIEDVTLGPDYDMSGENSGMGDSGPGFLPQADPNVMNPNVMNKMGLSSDDLLPSENNFESWEDDTFQKDSMFNEGPTLDDRNFLDCGYHYGINTVGQSLRNANQQIRSDPPIPQVDIGPWSQSTIEHDFNRRQLEVGGDFDC